MRQKYAFCTIGLGLFINSASALSLVLFIFINIQGNMALTCPADTWACSDGIECINVTSRCNSIVDCSDASDEGALCNSTCTANQFRCATGDQCIRREYICDHDNDCQDGSDERNCTYPACSTRQFTCANNRCIDVRYVCDGDNDCGDKSDEKLCSARNCPPGKLACNTTSSCVDINSFCNGIRDCPDGSDESHTCSSRRCSALSCLYSCHQTPTGGICTCPTGKMLSPADNRTCIDINECDMWDECDQQCLNTNGSYTCQCNANYTLLADGYCQSRNSQEARVIFSIGSKIYETDQNGQNVRLIFNNDDMDVSNFDYNFAKKIFYLTDEKSNKVYKGVYDPINQLSAVPLFGDLMGPFSIAVDWITDKIYLAQTTLSRIDVFTSDGKNRTDLITANIFSPTSIAVDPIANFLFYTDAGNWNNKLQGPKIERAFMDGTERHVIVSDKLLEPQALTLDTIKKRIFWIDLKYDHLESCSYFGTRRHIIASGSTNLPHSISIDVFESTIYYADTTKIAIMKLRRHAITRNANVSYHYKLNGNSVLPKNVKIYHGTKQSLSRQNPCAINNGGCQHFCLLSHLENAHDASGNQFRCKCKTGYELNRDLLTCKRITNSLFYSQQNSIRGIALGNNMMTETRPPVIMPRFGSVRTIEVDCQNNLTFFYDPIRRAIFQNKLNNDMSSTTEALIPNGLQYVENLSYDWISNNLYFTNSGRISVIAIAKPKERRDVVVESGIFALAVDPNVGYLFYSTISRPAKIIRTYLDGSHPKVIAQRELSLPYTISIDYQAKKVYWADSHLSKIQFSDYDGNQTTTLSLAHLAMPISIAIYKYKLYFVDYKLSSIFEISKTYGTTPVALRNNLNYLYQIKVFASDLQDLVTNHPCARQNGDCSHFCFAAPSTDGQYTLTRHCGCPYGFKLDSNMATCITNPDEPTTETCLAPSFFKCANDRCVRARDKCDGVNDCLDFSDEQSCPTFYCSADQFKCRNGTCLPGSKRCDGRIDCADFSDEIQCPRATCRSGQFRCNNGSCIPNSWRCDSENDCGDASDERNCTIGQCNPLTQFECHGQAGKCIDKSYVCDGDNDCGNNYDEENCPEFTCPTGQFKCGLDRLCLNQTRVCDGFYDCPSYSDEANCRFAPAQQTCRENQFQCTSSTSSPSFLTRHPISCLPRSWYCDGHVDCQNGSDEPSTCRPQTCSIGYFKCTNNKCIPDIWKCDGDNDCGDNSDENQDCPVLPFRCASDQVRCGSLDLCINQTKLCDNVENCPGGSDEGAFCSRDDCASQNGGCSHFCHRSPMGALCMCPTGYETSNATNFKKCEDIDECKLERSCSQLCANYRGGYSCACTTGFARVDGKYCKAMTRDMAKVYVTNGYSLLVTDLEGKRVRAFRDRQSMRRLTAFDFHNSTGRIYWADRSSKGIYSSYENGTDIVKIMGSGVSVVEALAVDWIGGNMYWADYVMQHIEVSRLDGKRRRILFNQNVTNPRALILDPRAKSRFIFWSDWGKYPRIERANMDGTGRRAIVTSKLYWPNGLTLDLIRERLYYADAHLDFIESCDYNGENRMQLVANTLAMHHAHSLSFFEDNVFWVDRGHRQLMRTSRFKPMNVTSLNGLSSRGLTVKVAHGLLQPAEANPCLLANCEHLCLLAKNTTNGYKCACQIGYLEDSSNSNRCNPDESAFLMVLNQNTIGGLKIFPNDTSQADPTVPLPSTLVDPNDDPASIGTDLSGDETAMSQMVRQSGFLWDRLVPVNDISHGFDFAYDYRTQNVYWLQHNRSSYSLNIHRVKFDGEDREVFVSNDDELFSSPFCLEFDATSRNLIVGNLVQSFLEVINVDTRNRAPLYSNSESELGVGYPIRLSVDAGVNNEVFWIDAGLGIVPKKIAGVRMDGTQARIIVKDDLNQPIALHYHRTSQELYWADCGKKTIESVSTQLKTGTASRSTIISDVEYPFALTIWDTPTGDQSILYYTDQIQEQLVAFNLKTSEKRVLQSNVASIMQLKLYQMDSESSAQSAGPCLPNNGGCHQICIPSATGRNGRVCKCSNGLELQFDGSCVPYKSFLLFASGGDLRGIPFPANPSNTDEALPVLGGRAISSVDFHFESKSIVWIEDNNLVKVLNLNFSWISDPRKPRSVEFIQRKTLFELESSSGHLMGLAIDWINNLLYYSYFDAPNSYIRVTNFPDIDYHYTLFKSNRDKPSLIAVNPKLRYLYWIDQGQFPKLERAFLDGTNRTVLVSTSMDSPTDLFIDQTTGDVYWSDNTKDTIERCSWNGLNRTVIRSTNLPNTQAVFVQDQTLYYADSRLRGVYSLNIANLSSIPDKVLIKRVKTDTLNDLLIFNDKSQPTNIVSPCTGSNRRSLCEQLCFPMPAGVVRTSTCACAIGVLSIDTRTCNRPSEYLIFAMENEIRSINLPVSNNIFDGAIPISGIPWKPVTGLSRAIGIDFDYRDNKILFSDLNDHKIGSFMVNVENPVVQDVIKQNVSLGRRQLIRSPEGITYNWVTDTIYYADNDLNQVIRQEINSGMRYVISYSQSPRAVAVHPCKGLLFWTDVGSRPIIARSSLVGSNYKQILTTDIKWPNGLSIDFERDRLYWADAYYNKIESCDFDGNFRQVLSTALHPFALTVHGHFIYWSDWSTRSIHRAEKYRGSNTITLVQGLPKRPMDLQIWSEQRQLCSYNPCSVYNGGCSHICSVSSPGNKTECRCPYGMRLRLTNNDRTCTPIALTTCNSTQFTCANGQCINKRFVCDGVAHCPDSSDEAANYCAYHQCQASEFRCRNGRCIPQPERCDRVDQCGDNSDESGCVYPTCNTETEFQCRNFKCIPLANRCDGIIDCQDGNSSDEIGCPPITCNSTRLSVKCPNTNICIMRRWLCDGDNDCGDSADENRLFCNSVPCSSGQFRCNDHKCIPFSWYCDGDRDCSGGEDEPRTTCQAGNYTCPDDMFRCDTGRCINRNFVCDGDRDCADNSDEDERHGCLDRQCRPNEFRCESGVRGRNHTKCISLGEVCDGHPSCVKTEDESPTLANCTMRQCRSHEFQCANGLCVNRNYMCDHDDDCGDGSDEPHNCTFRACRSNEFKCDNQRCVSESRKCNGRNDCFDNSDEKPEICKEPDACPAGQFRCKNNQCIAVDSVCNNQRDCTDNSDEQGCGVNECASPILNRCDHECQNTLTSFRCSCRPGYKLFDRYRCIDINECKETPYVCDQLCENRPGSYNCKCADGYEKVANTSHQCKYTGHRVEASLLFTNNYYLRNISLDSYTYQLVKGGFSMARGIAYNYNRSKIYVLDAGHGQLVSLKVNTSLNAVVTNASVLVKNLPRTLRGLAFDWITNKLYFLTNNKLVVCDENGNYMKVLLNETTLSEATSLVLDPIAGYVFLTDWKFPAYIGRVDMDGQNFKKIVSTDINSPIGLTIDLITQRIWWSDTHLKKIELSNYNGTSRFVAIDSNLTAYPFSLAFYDANIYWTDRGTDSIYVANALNGSSKTVVKQNTIHSVFGMNVYHQSLQPSGNQNPCTDNNGGCSHLCLISPSGDQNYTCGCPSSYLLDDNGKTCTANCSSWHFRCGMPEERCVPFYWKCDGESDCKDGSDELGCPARTCPIGQRQCNNSNCVSLWKVCNGADDCGDNSDEADCPIGCPPGRFQCPIAPGRCLYSSQVCNGYSECGDVARSDEANCQNQTCPASSFRCDSGHCIDAAYYCDTDFDCPDRSDEPAHTCRNRACPTGWTRCRNSYKCIHSTQLCDGHVNCAEGDDEAVDRCPTCHETGDFKCANGRCVMLSLRCNGEDDCGDGSDEANWMCSSLPRRECSESEFQCDNGNCIRGSWRCDHDNDCGDNSDEQNCASHTCGESRWQCASGHCIRASQHCDGNRNCLDYSDESECSPRFPGGKYCMNSSFTCDNHVCTNPNYQCDGDNDCGDNSDESVGLCAGFNCTQENNRFRCKNGNCISSHALCNGFHDCSDNSDEDFSANGPCKRNIPQCTEDEFKCAKNHYCIPMEYLCDNDLDCGDGDQSDELGCYNNRTVDVQGLGLTCESNRTICEHNCTDFPQHNGFFCSCQHGFKMEKLNTTVAEGIHRHTCIDVNECDTYESNMCTQKCVNTKGSFKCACDDSYLDPHGDGTVCEAGRSGEDAVILLAYGSEIRQIRQNLSEYVYSGLVEGEQFVLAIDIDPVERYFYWIDDYEQKIKRAYIPNTKTAQANEQILTALDTSFENENELTALAIDWIGRNIYFSDGKEASIQVARVDGRYKRTIIRENAQLVYSLAVNPTIGMIFWIESDVNAKIMSAWLNGENQRVVIGANLDHPTGLAIDFYKENRIYWCDPKNNFIESANFDGSDRSRIYHNGLEKPYRIDIFENHIYWLSQEKGSVNKIDKFGRGGLHNLVDHLDMVDDFKVYHSQKMPKVTGNPCANATCSHLCLIKPNNQYECACPENTRFLENDLFTCDSGLAEPMDAPLACNCINCWCTYNNVGVHFKCYPGWDGNYCQIDKNADHGALMAQLSLLSKVMLPIIFILLIAGALVGLAYQRQKNNQAVIPWTWAETMAYVSSLIPNSAGGTSEVPSSTLPSNSELNEAEQDSSLSLSTSSARSSFGLFNPAFLKNGSSKQQAAEDAKNNTELAMNQIESSEANSSIEIKPMEVSDEPSSKLSIKNIFSSNIEKDKIAKNKKKSDERTKVQFDPSTKETFNDTEYLVEESLE